MIARLFFSLLLAWGLIGCATTYDPEKLTKASVNMPIEIKWFLAGSLFINGQAESVLFAGVYQPEYEDSSGVFYKGMIAPMPALHPQMKRNSTPQTIDGGLWVAKCHAQPLAQPRQVRAYFFERKVDSDGIVKTRIKVKNAGFRLSDTVLAQFPPCL